jgi:hypothetical protein
LTEKKKKQIYLKKMGVWDNSVTVGNLSGPRVNGLPHTATTRSKLL